MARSTFISGIEGHIYPFEQALKSGGDVVVSSGRAWLLGADDRLTMIEDHHVSDMAKADFDELVDGTGPLRYQVGPTTPLPRWPSTRLGRPRSGPASSKFANERGQRPHPF